MIVKLQMNSIGKAIIKLPSAERFDLNLRDLVLSRTSFEKFGGDFVKASRCWESSSGHHLAKIPRFDFSILASNGSAKALQAHPARQNSKRQDLTFLFLQKAQTYCNSRPIATRDLLHQCAGQDYGMSS